MLTVNLMLSGQNKRGFSLIDVAILISLLSVVIVAAFEIFKPSAQVKNTQFQHTRDRLDTIKAALHRHVVRYGRLPCPASLLVPLADQDNLTNTVLETQELRFDAEKFYADTVSNVCPENIGALPTGVLGLSYDLQLDGWGRRFTYVVSESLCGGQASHSCTPSSFAINDGDLILEALGGGSNEVTNAAYIIISHGESGAGGYNAYGTRITQNSGNADEYKNTNKVLLNSPVPTITGANNAAVRTTLNSYMATPANKDLGGPEPANNRNVFRLGQFSHLFDQVVVYQTKADLLQAIPGDQIGMVNATDCLAVKTAVSQISRATSNGSYTAQADLDSSFNGSLNLLTQYASAQNPGEGVLELLWLIQDYCFNHIDANVIDSGDPVPGCPGGASWVASQKLCRCANGNFDGTC